MQLKFVQLGLSMLALATPSLAAAVPTSSANMTSEAPVTPTARPVILPPVKPFFNSAGFAWTEENFQGKKYKLDGRGGCLSVDNLPRSGLGRSYEHPGHGDDDDEGSGYHPSHHEDSDDDEVDEDGEDSNSPGSTPSHLSFESFKINKDAKCTVFLNSKCRKNFQFPGLKLYRSWKELKTGKYPDTGKFGPIKSVSCTSTPSLPHWPPIFTLSAFNSTLLAI